MNLKNFAFAVGGATVTVFIGIPLFRVILYAHMYLAPDAPFGISDVIEFFLGWLLIVLLALSTVTATVLAMRAPKAQRSVAIWLIGMVAAIVLSVRPLFELATRHMLR